MKRSLLLTAPILLVVGSMVWLLGATTLVAELVASPTPTAVQSPDKLTPDQIQLVDGKKRAAETAGVVYSPETPNELSFPQPVSTEVKKIRLTREDIQSAFEQSLLAMQDRLKLIEEQEGPDVARAVEAELLRQSAATQAQIPEAGLDLDVPVIEVGSGSITRGGVDGGGVLERSAEAEKNLESCDFQRDH